ncbi:MAG: hypothetical protein JSV33_11850 [bacterium]|nr:MAG: hypothetical protein JSV33_11850 [bacterium]
MVRCLCLVLAVLSIASCRPSRRSSPLPHDASPGDGGRLGVTEEEYEMMERLKECPLDLGTASVEDLCSIPDFPIDLAERVVEARASGGSPAQWIRRLTPHDRERLYRFEEFCVLPERLPLRFRARLAEERITSGCQRRRKAYIAIAGEGYRATARIRADTHGSQTSFYLSRRLLSGRLRFHAGDFALDFAMGLLYSGAVSSYPFTTGYPVGIYRGFMGRTSFFGAAMRGGGADIYAGGMHLLAFGGVRRFWKSTGIVYEDMMVSGIRAVYTGRCWEIGSSMTNDPFYGTDCLYGLDGRYRLGRLTIGAEAVGIGGMLRAGGWGVLLRGKGFDTGFLFYEIPYRSASRFGSVAGRRVKYDAAQKGVSLVIRGLDVSGLKLNAAFDRSASFERFEEQGRHAVRIELAQRWGPVKIRSLFRWSSYRSDGVIPVPGPPDVEYSSSRRVKISAEWRALRMVTLGTTCQYERGSNLSGGMIAPVLHFEIPSKRVDCTALYAVYRSFTGRLSFSIYEPSLEGSYPWHRAYGSGGRGVFRIRCTFGALRTTYRLGVGHGGKVEGDVQVRVKL